MSGVFEDHFLGPDMLSIRPAKEEVEIAAGLLIALDRRQARFNSGPRFVAS